MNAELLTQLMSTPEYERAEAIRRLVAEQNPEYAALVATALTSEEPAERPAPRTASIQRLVHQYRDAIAALTAADEELDALAAALGACDMCWGVDNQCSRCGGDGDAGWRRPDPDEFAHYIAPLFRARPELLRALSTTSTRQSQQLTERQGESMTPTTKGNAS